MVDHAIELSKTTVSASAFPEPRYICGGTEVMPSSPQVGAAPPMSSTMGTETGEEDDDLELFSFGEVESLLNDPGNS